MMWTPMENGIPVRADTLAQRLLLRSNAEIAESLELFAKDIERLEQRTGFVLLLREAAKRLR